MTLTHICLLKEVCQIEKDDSVAQNYEKRAFYARLAADKHTANLEVG